MRVPAGATAGALLAAVVLAWGCASQHGSPRLAENIFAADGVEIPEGSSPEELIRAVLERSGGDEPGAAVTIDYPLEGSVFPPEITSPTFLWHDASAAPDLWLIDVTFEDAGRHVFVLTRGERPKREIDYRCVTENNVYSETEYQASARGWTPAPDVWDAVKRNSVERDATVSVLGLAAPAGRPGTREIVSRGSVRIRTSADPVGALIFYRDVPLMPTKTVEGVIQPLAQSMFPLIQWRLRDISRRGAPVVMDGLPTCGNCHTFSSDGKTLAMDMDGPAGDKGAYVVKDISQRMVIEQEDVFTWNDFPGRATDKTTFGLFSRISPDGRHVVSMVNEDIFVANYPDILFQQTFYPTRGILVVYSRETGEIRSLPGADDPRYVQANPAWSPDGKSIVFLRAEAGPAYADGPLPEHANDPRETPMRFDVYRIPFNEGRGGVAEPLQGASDNGMSNSFPRFSPDGKWIVFVQAKNGMLLRPDSKLYIIPAEGGEARLMSCNTERMNSYHSWSPNSRWLVFSSKQNSPYTQMFLTHVDQDGYDTPPVLVPNSTPANRAVNLPEFISIVPGDLLEITTPAVDYRRRLEAAVALRDEGRIDDAIAELRSSLELKSDYWDTHLTLANILLQQGKPRDSIEHYERALELNPRYFFTLFNFGVALRDVGRYDDAARHFETALEISPESVSTHNGLGLTLALAGDSDRAARHFREALRIDPRSDFAHYELGVLLERAGQFHRAAEHLGAAVEINPGYYSAHHKLGRVLLRLKRTMEAIAHYRRAIEINADYHPAYDSLALVLASHADRGVRDGAAAVRLAEAACRETAFENAGYLRTLAAAYAEEGRFEDAVGSAERALSLARLHRDSALAGEIERQLALFRTGRPLRTGG